MVALITHTISKATMFADLDVLLAIALGGPSVSFENGRISLPATAKTAGAGSSLRPRCRGISSVQAGSI
jgi:hypothetical protein